MLRVGAFAYYCVYGGSLCRKQSVAPNDGQFKDNSDGCLTACPASADLGFTSGAKGGVRGGRARKERGRVTPGEVRRRGGEESSPAGHGRSHREVSRDTTTASI